MALQEPSPSLPLFSRLGAADERALRWVISRRTPALVWMMARLTRTADAPVVAVLLAVALALWPERPMVMVSAATTLGLTLFLIAKRLCNRPRPDGVHAVLAAPDRFSMPSGHATAAFAIAVATIPFSPLLGAVLCVWAIAVAISRVIVGVHYPFDVVAGAACGSLGATTLHGLFG